MSAYAFPYRIGAERHWLFSNTNNSSTQVLRSQLPHGDKTN